MNTSYIRCIGFAWSEKDAVCIFNDQPYSADSMNNVGVTFRRIVQSILESDAEKTFHNGMFDTIMLEANGFTVKNFTYDTMIAQHVLQPELPLGLDFCTSVYTNINYYKNDGKETSDKIDRKRLGTYNCKDVVATWKVKEMQLAEFAEADPAKHTYFLYKMKQLPLAKHFSLTGMLVDEERRQELATVVTSKRDADYTVFVGIQQMTGLAPEELFKVSQSAKIKEFLYGRLELPTKRNRDGEITADEDAIVGLIATVERKVQELKTDKARQPWNIKLAALKLILRIRGYDKLLGSYINIDLSPDGRARSWYKFWGTETGRWSAASWYDGTGLNGQTIPRESL
jgi:DNA polymerase I-like protein with 3'-5' exonuclease and polymerase domains